MVSIDQARYAQIQSYEFEFWQNNPVDFQVLWSHYLPPFAPYMQKHYHRVVDVGCGPTPFFLSGYFGYDEAIAVDPLIYEYALLPQYASLYDVKFLMRRGLREVEVGFANVVFALNVLDHVRDTRAFMFELGRVCAPGGMLFLFVDIDKPPDQMHPHRIEKMDVVDALINDFDLLLVHQEPSWKFDNPCLWVVGRRIGGHV